MCLAVPGRVVDTDDAEELRMGRVAFGGIVRQVCLECVPEAEPGDYVLVHVGFALSRIDEAEAERIFEMLRELGEVEAQAEDDGDAEPAKPRGSPQ